MARKTFFAAFVIDEEHYTPEPGPVDSHFVACDLAQSGFGEQPGVSNFLVWESADDLISDHRGQGPITVDYLESDAPAKRYPFADTPETCSPRRWNRDDEICGNLDHIPTVTSPVVTKTTQETIFRDHLSQVMQAALAFEYYMIRPCIERVGQITSYFDEGDYAAALAGLQNSVEEFRTFWTLYGVDAGAHTAIGDFTSNDAAHEVMNAILAVPAAARNAINGAMPVRRSDRSQIEHVAGKAADWLDDMINQSSNQQRI